MADTAGRNIYIGVKGTVIAINRSTGAIVWKSPLKGFGFVNVVVDGDDVIACTKGEVFCLDPSNGSVRWNNPLCGFGFGLATIATTGTNSIVPMAEQKARDAAAG